jgi:hypothetical protein
MAIKIKSVVFWDMMLYTDVAGYQRFRGPYYLHLYGAVNGTRKWT